MTRVQSWDPRRASRAAHWAQAVTQALMPSWSFTSSVTTSSGPWMYPTLQPVME